MTPVIDIDALPLCRGVHDAADYIGIQIFGLCSLPLFSYCARERGIVPLACSDHTMLEEGRLHRFRIGEQWRWSDGQPVTAEDYRRGILYVLSQSGHPAAYLLHDIENYRNFRAGRCSADLLGVSVEATELVVRLQRSNWHFQENLSAINFSPRRDNSCSETAGAYRMEELSEHGVVVRRNPWFPDRNHQEVADEVRFRLFRSRYAALKAYEKGDIQLTCNTMFPYERLATYQRRSDFYRDYSNISMRLEALPRSSPVGVDPLLWQLFRAGLDRDNLVRSFHGALAIQSDYRWEYEFNPEDLEKKDTFFDPDSASELASHLHQKYGKRGLKLTVAVDDFYPNGEVMAAILKQMRAYGITLTVVKDNYYAPKGNTDLKLFLLFPFVQSNVGTYLPWLFHRPLVNKKEAWKTFASAYRTLTTCSKERCEGSLNTMDHIILEHSNGLPLFKMQSLYLKDPSLVHDDFCPGQLIRFG